MQRAPWLVIAALVTPLLWGQPERIRFIPALAYGPDMWSIVRLTNSGTTPRSVRIDVYRQDGMHLPIGPVFDVAPGTTRDVRIELTTKTVEGCWAQVVLAQDVAARGIIEVVKGNALEDFPREPAQLSGLSEWVTSTTGLQGKDLYFLNVADQPTVVSLCSINRAEPGPTERTGRSGGRACQEVDGGASFRVGPNQAMVVRVKKLGRKFFVIESSMPGAAVLVVFEDSAGRRRIFDSKSAIEFGDVVQ